ncbi:hypothetical protein QE177_15640 (plasmid) [Arsenophonus sp. aPb]|uniref:hypothetical protein n=1 Tax=Arsenophonus sp. aPb TaxID=3041619 RepID=UPI002468EF24|nr:hypothetical protein [Arsenophonus sp. aPb]WGL99945.1 hypothetical protein QE177_15640 [Arsenophonus sp. aPb]
MAINEIPSSNKPIVDILQVPHHGSRRNLSSELLDFIIGNKFRTQKEAEEAEKIISIISAGKK